ncbi:NAD(P)H-dependent oxidoreductase [Sneathiella marina]|uniref:NAD(P)H-dependent oxidoreductase n=1 Tax=Sneathiella marina TaxID=2950108 RepID=A0ABY4VX63_9PROT|nr:NAD(P)H-dependent oxidoreductase [Sneathiella marina]USG59525.1 NAD(P)H-dependent oxidoreductase [Sneathiella marina]
MTATKIGIIIGSNRKISQSGRIAEFVHSLINNLQANVSVDLFSVRDMNLPLWSEEKWQSNSSLVDLWKPFSSRLKECDGFIVISPEWAGMAPPHLKNFLLMCDGGELAHKPGLLIGVSSGFGGAYPVAELRMSGYKNNFLWWLPDHVILRHVESLFVEEPPTKLDVNMTNRLNYSLEFLVETAIAMAPVREKVQNLATYKHGM